MKRNGLKGIICAVLTLALLFSLAGAAMADQVLLDLDFSDRSGLWFYLQDGGQGQMYFENGAVMADVYTPGDTEWAVQAYCTGIQLVQGTTYELSMDVRSSAERDVTMGLQHNGGSWKTYAANTVRAGHGMHRYALQFRMNEPTDDNVLLFVNMGYFDSMKGTSAEEQHQVYVDNLSLKVIEETVGGGGRSTDPYTGGSDLSAPSKPAVPAEPVTDEPTPEPTPTPTATPTPEPTPTPTPEPTPTPTPTATPTPKPTEKADEETLFDKYAKPRSKSSSLTLIENNHPAYASIPSARFAFRNENVAETAFSMAWYDLLEGELAMGIPINDTFAADIYRGMTNKNVYITVAATGERSDCVNFIVAVLDKKADRSTGLHYGSLYWIEWNSAKDTIRAANQYSGDDQLYASWALNATGGNPILSRFPPEGSLHLELNGSKDLQGELIIMYATKNDRKMPPIK